MGNSRERKNLLVADGQLLTTTGAAARQDVAASLGLHAGAEAVGFGPLTVVGLVSTLHDTLDV